MKLKQQFIILLTIFIVFPSILTVLVSSIMFRDKAIDLVKNNIVTASTDKADKISSYFEQIHSNLSFITHTQSLQEFLQINSGAEVPQSVSDRYSDNRKFVSSLIYDYKQRTPFVIGVMVADRNDKVLLCDDVSFLNKNVDFVKGMDTLGEKQYNVSTVMGSKNYSNVMTTCISVPVYVDGTYMGYITALISPEYYETVIGLEKFFETGSVTIVAPDDSILATGSSIFRKTITNLPVQNTFINQWKNIDFENSRNGIVEFTVNNVPKFAYYTHLENVGVKILCDVNASEISDNIIDVLFIALACILVVTIFVIIISMVYLNKFIAPINAMVIAVKDFSDGKEDVHVSEKGHNEFTALAKEFNSMVCKITKHNKSLEETNESFNDILNNSKAGLFKLRVDTDFSFEYANDEFMRMIECERSDFYDRYNDDFVNTIYYQDKRRVRLNLLKYSHEGETTEFEYRIEQTDGTFIWVNCRTCVVSDAFNNLFLYGCLTNSTEAHRTIEELSRYEDIYRIVSERSEDIICEYDYITDKINYNSKWISKFGYNVPETDVYKFFAEATPVYPSDRESFVAWFMDNYGKNTDNSIEFRVKDIADEYIWVNMKATTIFNSLDEPVKMIIILSDITARKEQIAELTHMVEIDQLTGIYNKIAVQNHIEELLKESSDYDRHALLIADIDNFKAVNDNFGHLLGDNVLTELTDGLKKNLGEDNILGRIGGDEFVILLKNIKGEEELKEKCKKICKLFNKEFKGNDGVFSITGSVGVAEYPIHGMRFTDLYANADNALYDAKNLGKNRYCMFNPAGSKGYTYTKNFDRDNKALEVRQNRFKDSFIQYVFTLLNETKEFDNSINTVLTMIGKNYHVSRVYVFENDETNMYCDNTYEWCNIGIVPEKENLQHVMYSDIDNHNERFNANGMFLCNDISTLPENTRKVLENQGIVSMIHCAIKHNGQFRGFIGFDECSSKRSWTQEEISTLNLISKIIGVFILRKRQEEAIHDRDNIIEGILDTKKCWAYIIDGQTLQLKYVNNKLKSFSQDSDMDSTCYDFFTKCDRRDLCPDRPIFKLIDDPTIMNASAVIKIPNLDVLADVSATRIKLQNSSDCYLMYAKYKNSKKD